MSLQEFIKFKLHDKGTRYQFYRELLDMWEVAHEIVANLSYQSDHDKRKEAELKAGITLLRKQVDVMSGFEDGMYFLRRTVDGLPSVTKEFVDGEGEG